MSLEIELLKLLSERHNHFKYIKYIKNHTLTDKANVILNDYTKMFDDDQTLQQIDFSIYDTYFDILHGEYKQDKKKIFKKIIGNINDATVSTAVEKILSHYITIDGATKAYDTLNKMLDGDNDATIDAVIDILEETQQKLNSGQETEDDDSSRDVVTTSFDEIVNTTVLGGGVEWRLEDLNVSIGPVRDGDFILLAARPEVGKTSFITSETSHMATQLPDDRGVLFFNNEESGAKVQSRYYQSALNKTSKEIASDPKGCQEEYIKLMGRLDKIQVLHPEYLDTRYIEKKVREYRPGIIIINTLDEVHGFGTSENNTTKLKKLYVWARELAGRYNCACFAVAQADASAEGQRYLHQGQLDESKTGKPKTADIIIMIGKDHALVEERFISIPKNKAPSGPRVDPALSHSCHEVKFDSQRGRYNSVKYK